MTQYTKTDLLLSIENVSLSFDDRCILHDINLQIHDIVRPELIQGQIIALVGRSGSGKSTLFNLLSGYIKPNIGTIKVDVDQHDVRIGEMGVVPQNYPLFEHRTIFDNLSLALKSQSGTIKITTINEYASHFELTEQLEKYPCDLSGGQKQRVSILQQVLAGNKFILMDEPFSGLDSLMKDKVIDLMLKVANLDEKNTIVVVSHDIESSCAIADTVYVLANNDGKGSTIVNVYDFLQEDLAYRENIKEIPKFRQIIKEIKNSI